MSLLLRYVGVTTASKRCDLCRSRKDWDVSSRPRLERGQSASDPVLVHECDHLLQMLYFSFGKKHLDMHPVNVDVSHFV